MGNDIFGKTQVDIRKMIMVRNYFTVLADAKQDTIEERMWSCPAMLFKTMPALYVSVLHVDGDILSSNQLKQLRKQATRQVIKQSAAHAPIQTGLMGICFT